MRKLRGLCIITLLCLLVNNKVYANETVTEDGLIVEDGEVIGSIGYNPDAKSRCVIGEDNRVEIPYDEIVYPYSTVCYIEICFSEDESLYEAKGIERNKYLNTTLDIVTRSSGFLVSNNYVLTVAHSYEIPVIFSNKNNKLSMRLNYYDSISGKNIEEKMETIKNIYIKDGINLEAQELDNIKNFITKGKNEYTGFIIDMDLIEEVAIVFKFDKDYSYKADLIKISNPVRIEGKKADYNDDSLMNGDIYIHYNYYNSRSYGALKNRVADLTFYPERDSKYDMSYIKLPVNIGNTYGWLGLNYKYCPKYTNSVIGQCIGYPSKLAKDIENDNKENAEEIIRFKMYKDYGSFYLGSNTAVYPYIVSRNIDTTAGNSGGPAVVSEENSDKYIAIGITSGSHEAKDLENDESINYFSCLNSEKINLLKINKVIGDISR